MNRPWWPLRWRRRPALPPPKGTGSADPFDEFRDAIGHYAKHRVLVALLYESGGRIDVRADTIRSLRDRDQVVVEANPDCPGAVVVRLGSPPPEEFRFRTRFRW